MIDMHSDFRFALLRNQYKGSKCWAGSSISSRISWYLQFKNHTKHSLRVPYWCSHPVIFNLYKIVKKYGIWKISSFYYCIRLVSHLRNLYGFYHSRPTRTWSICNEMYHNVFRYAYLTFQTDSFTQTIYLWYKILFKVNMRFFFLSVYIVIAL